MILKIVVVISKHPTNGRYDVRDIMFNEQYFDCIHIGGNHDHPVPFELGDMVALITDDNYNYIMAYHDKSYSIYEGIKYIFMGDEDALVYDCDGSFRISKVIKSPDGTIKEIPRFTYDSDKVLDLQLSEYNIAVSGLSAFVGELDPLGFFSHKFTSKGRYDDIGIRYNRTLKGSVNGIKLSEIVDVTPSPVGGVPEKLMPLTLPLSITEEKSSTMPYDLYLKALAIKLAGISISPIGEITITSGISPTGSEINISPTGEINIKNKNTMTSIVVGIDGSIEASNALSSIKLDAIGKVSITGTFFDANAATGSLIGLITDIFTTLATHVHPTGTGPSGPPVTAPDIITKNVLLTGMKG